MESPQITLCVGWRGSTAKGRLLDLEEYLVAQVTTFLRSHHMNVLGSTSGSMTMDDVGPTVMQMSSYLTRHGFSSDASVSTFSRPDYVLGSSAVCDVLGKALPTFSLVPVALEFEAVKTTYTEQHSDQTHVEFRLCTDKNQDRSYVSMEQPQEPLVYDTRNALTLGLEEKMDCLPNALGRPVSAVAASLLPAPFPPLSRERAEKEIEKRSHTKCTL